MVAQALTGGGTHLLHLLNYAAGVAEIGGGPQSGKAFEIFERDMLHGAHVE